MAQGVDEGNENLNFCILEYSLAWNLVKFVVGFYSLWLGCSLTSFMVFGQLSSVLGFHFFAL